MKKINDKIKLGTATYHEAHSYSISLGEILSKVFDENISSGILPNGKMYYNIGQKVIEPMMLNNFDLISDNVVEIQELLNKKAGLSLAGQAPALNRDRIDGIVQRLADEEVFDDIKWLLQEPIVNFSQAIVDDGIKANADFQYKSGLNPKIIRTANAGCCKWCSQLAGTYDYPIKNQDVYRRHGRCRCETDFNPGDGKKQNVWDKTWR